MLGKGPIQGISPPTSLGIQTEDLNMGGFNIEDIKTIYLKAVCCVAHNNTGSTLAAGVCVYPTGEVGGVVTIAKCDNTDADKMPCLGVVSLDIANGASGRVVCIGTKSMNTSGFAGDIGDRIYVQSDGTVTTTEPSSGSVQRIGILITKAVAGKIYIHVRGRKSIYAASSENISIRMGDNAGANKTSYKDYANNEVASIDSDGNQLMLSTSVKGSVGGFKRLKSEVTVDITAAATVTIQANVPTNAKLLGVQMRVDAALAAGETWIAAYSGGASQNIVTDAAVAQNTKVNKFFDENAATAITSGETDIDITKTGGGAFTAQGTLRAIVYYEEFTTLSDV